MSGAAIEHASLGEYDEGALRGLSPDRRERFFEPVGGRYRVTEDLRRHLVFARHDLHRDPPFGNLHLVTCRNVLIYFRKEWQRRVLSTLHVSLRAGGVLFLGDSESVADQSLYFEPAGAKVHRVYRRRVGRTDLLPVSPPQRARSAPVRQRVSAVDDARDMLFAAYVPATAVVNAAGEVEHLIGDVADYLSLPTGRMTPRIDRLARGGLGTAVSAALARCQRTGELAEHPAVSLPGTERSVRVMVRPIAGVERYLVTFASAPTSASGAENASSLDLAHVHDELLSTRESLEATIEELQAANEELQASNEEMHASNEELQATNEELHATNEELHVLTAERNERIHELDRLTDDVFNLLNATGVATLFLDEQLCIRRLIGPVGAYLRLLDVDVGRPLSHFRDGLVGLDLLALASNVLEQQEPFESHGAQVNGMRVLVRALPYASASGRDRGVVLGFVDVTDLKETQERLRGVLDSLPQHVALVDEAGRLAMVNDSWRRFAESQGGSVQLGADYLAIAAADPSASGIAKGIEDVLAGDRGHFSAVYPCATPDRELRFRMDASPLIAGEPGRVVGAVVSHMNTTLLHEAEQSTQEAMVAFRRVFESSTASLLVVDTETLIVSDINAAACALLRRSSEAVVGSSMEMLVPSGRSEVWRSTLQGLPPDGEVLRMLEVLDGDGFDRAMNVVLRSLYSEQQRFALVELRVASGAVAEASAGADGAVSTRRLEALGKLAGGVAHETNNVLAGIVAVVEPWIESEQVDPELRGELQDVLAACRRGKDVTQQLLGFARADTVVRPTDVGAVVREIATSLRAMAAEGVRIEVSTAPELVVLGDRTLLAQALLNLGINGLDAIGQRGLLEIRVSEVSVDGGLAALIEVRDDGHGMEASVAARAFEPFYTTKPRGEGTGLGLPMVYGTVRSMNGVIEIQSVVSEGTTIAITLPLTEAPEKAPETPRERPTLHGRALVIDDDRLVRRGIARMLKRCGMDVLTAEGGEEGLSLLDSHRLDLVVLDVVMPDIDGWETLRRIRSRQPTLPVLMCSGYAENTRGVQAERGPETGFVYKPVGADELAKAAQALMTSRS
ncbi:MAG: CheR family methyltransferase [Myxococcota bacterium]